MDNITIDILLKEVSLYNKEEIASVKKAYDVASKAHSGQKRASGEDYITHPLNVAYILSQMMADRDTLCAALLHDVIEDTNLTKKDVASLFNENIAKLVDGVSKIKGMNFGNSDEENAANLHKLIMGINSDVRIIIIKLADRLHNMRTLEYKKEAKQKSKARETLNIYVPLAERLGCYRIKKELEDLSLKYIDREAYEYISEKRKQIIIENKEMIDKIAIDVGCKLKDLGITNLIKFRVKNIYGIYKRIKRNLSLESIHDLLVLEVIVEDIPKCYTALYPIHEYLPVPKMTHDYISKPKTNLYQSIHTTVFAPGNKMVQFQIRTFEMDLEASQGIISYWQKLKGAGAKEMQNKVVEELPLYKYLKSIESISQNDEIFANLAQDELLAQSVYVRTRSGTLIELPKGSTPIDFAYNISEYLGDYFDKAIVNEKIVSSDYVLKNDDSILIITGETKRIYNEEDIKKVRTKYAQEKMKINLS